MGKALALDTPLPTPRGWTTMGEVAVGDQLLGADGRPTTRGRRDDGHVRPSVLRARVLRRLDDRRGRRAPVADRHQGGHGAVGQDHRADRAGDVRERRRLSTGVTSTAVTNAAALALPERRASARRPTRSEPGSARPSPPRRSSRAVSPRSPCTSTSTVPATTQTGSLLGLGANGDKQIPASTSAPPSRSDATCWPACSTPRARCTGRRIGAVRRSVAAVGRWTPAS